MSFDPMAPLGAHVVELPSEIYPDTKPDPATTADARRQALERFWNEQERYQIEAHAWELFRDAMNRGVHVGYSLREAFANAETFAAEAAKRRAAK